VTLRSAPSARTPIGERTALRGVRDVLTGVTRANAPGQVLAGVTLLAIAIPEQLATSRLAGAPAFFAMIAFIVATLVFVASGSNPIMSVGADSTIAPLFAVSLARLAPFGSSGYLEVVAVTAVVTGVVLAVIGVARLGWIADFLSAPIVAGFLAGIGLIIVVHQLPDALGVASGGSSIYQRLHVVVGELGHVSGWSIALALGTLALLVLGERLNARLPWALAGILVATVLAVALSLSHHGVAELGAVTVGGPQWRLRSLGVGQWATVLTTTVTLVIVILSQSAATTRTSADELGVETDVSRDFLGVGLANVAAGLVGAFPVDASPARTTVTRLAGGRTKLPGVVAAVLAIALSPLGHYAERIPLAALAGILFFIAARLVKLDQFARVWATSRTEFALAVVSGLGVVLVGVEAGIAIAVGLAMLAQTWRSARPAMLELGRRAGTTSWEPVGSPGVEREQRVLVLFFDADLFFANAGVFRRQLHERLAAHPTVRHVVLDAVAMADVDFTGLAMLADLLADLATEQVDVTLARATPAVRRALTRYGDARLAAVAVHDSVDTAVRGALSG
jgi:MFS superfamily sulfate permease-like transporter